jgi:hypothetical protein
MRMGLGLLAAMSMWARVDFATEVHPILAARCHACHTGAAPQAGLSLENRAKALRVLTPGASLLLKKVRGEAGMVMPPSGARLTAAQIATLERWIEEGADWPVMTADAKSGWIPPLAPREVKLPENGERHPVDRLLKAYFAATRHFPALVVSDELFYRRAKYDLWGLPPMPEELRTFAADRTADKRERLIDRLLDDREHYAGHWISFWNDLLRNDVGVNYHGDRKSITAWLEKALVDNLPYDAMLRALLNPQRPEDPEGFLVGVNWRGDINASQTPFMQASQNTAQVFLGINLKCASCHDSFINQYKLKQAYGLAAFFSAEPQLEMVRCDVKTGKMQAAEFLYPELGGVRADASLAERRAAAARLFTDPRNGRVARTVVNRYWQRLFGRGLVEPVDEMDNRPWNADVLDWLAVDFTAGGWDLKKLLRRLMTSKAYQMPSVVTKEQRDVQYTFRGPEPRRLTAEQFADTVAAVTGEWRVAPAGAGGVYARDWKLKSSALTRALGRPIRDQVYTTRDSSATTFQALELMNGPSLALMLRRGARRLMGELPEPPANLWDSQTMRKGASEFRASMAGAKRLYLLLEDAGCYDPERTVAGWADVELSGPSGVKKLTELTTVSRFTPREFVADKVRFADALAVPVGGMLVYDIDGMGFTEVRGKGVVDDVSRPSDIGGAVRFFVFGAEPDRAQLVRVTGGRPVEPERAPAQVDAAVSRWYRYLLGREPVQGELAVARRYFPNAKLEAAGMEDLLWSLLMHPEAQYLR